MKVNNILIYIFLAGLLLAGCRPKEAKDKDLPAPSAASFQMTKYNDPNFPTDENTYIFTNTTPGGFMASWDFGGIGKSQQMIDTIFFAYAGTYTIKLMAASPGGVTSTTKNLVIAATSPFAADFSITPGVDAHHWDVTVLTPSPISQTFTFPTGETATTTNASFYWPFSGPFDVTLDVVTAKGPSSLTKTGAGAVADDPANPLLNDPFLLDLTGGINDVDGKTWVLSPPGGNGGQNTLNQTEYSSTDYTDWNMSKNEFTFIFRNYQFIPKNQNVTVHGLYNNVYFGGVGVGQYDAVSHTDPNLIAAPFILYKDSVEIPASSGNMGDLLKITMGSYWGWFVNRHTYEIVSHSPTEIVIRANYDDNPANNPGQIPSADWPRRYFTFVPKP